MITTLESAAIANHVYAPQNGFLGNHPEQYFVQKGKCSTVHDGWYVVSDLDTSVQPSDAFYCKLYLKQKEKIITDAVVGIRGTVAKDINNIWEDLYGWFSDVMGNGLHDHPPANYLKAKQYVQDAQTYLEQYFPEAKNNLILTGHSLGGAVASLVTLNDFALPSITFNAPNCGHMPGISFANASLIQNVNARFDFVSKIGLSVGKIKLIDVPQMADDACALLHALDVALHQNNIFSFPEINSDSFLSKTESFLEKAKTFIATHAVIEKTQDFQQHLATYENAESQTFWEHFSGIGNIFLKDKAYVATYADIIEAQHSMDHMFEVISKN